MSNEQLQQKQMNEKNERKNETHNKIRAKKKKSSKHYSHSPAGYRVLECWK